MKISLSTALPLSLILTPLTGHAADLTRYDFFLSGQLESNQLKLINDKDRALGGSISAGFDFYLTEQSQLAVAFKYKDLGRYNIADERVKASGYELIVQPRYELGESDAYVGVNLGYGRVYLDNNIEAEEGFTTWLMGLQFEYMFTESVTVFASYDYTTFNTLPSRSEFLGPSAGVRYTF